VPLDKYLLREATARDAGFLEVRDKSTPEEQARQEALNRQRERLLAKRADDRHRARQRALEEAKATKEAERSSLMAEAQKNLTRVSGKTANMASIFGTRTERRRTAAARAVAGSGLNEKEIEKGCTLSVLLTEQRTRTAKERHMATRVDHVRDELKALKAYGRLGRAKARLGEANTLTSDDFLDDAGGGNVLLAVGARRKRRARLERRFNQASDLPPEREARRFAEAPPVQALAPLEKVHSSYPWDVQWPPDAADKVSEATRNDLARVSSIVATTEEAVNLQQRPLHPDMVVKEVVEW